MIYIYYIIVNIKDLYIIYIIFFHLNQILINLLIKRTIARRKIILIELISLYSSYIIYLLIEFINLILLLFFNK